MSYSYPYLSKSDCDITMSNPHAHDVQTEVCYGCGRDIEVEDIAHEATDKNGRKSFYCKTCMDTLEYIKENKFRAEGLFGVKITDSFGYKSIIEDYEDIWNSIKEEEDEKKKEDSFSHRLGQFYVDKNNDLYIWTGFEFIRVM